MNSISTYFQLYFEVYHAFLPQKITKLSIALSPLSDSVMQLITLENQDSKLDFMTYIHPAVIIISVIKSKSGSKSATKVCKRDVSICSEPYFNSKNHDFHFAISQAYVGLRR